MANRRIEWVMGKVFGKRILDIGFAGEEEKNAHLHRMIREKYPDSFIAGIDTNEELVKRYNFPNTSVQSFLDMKFEDGAFDTVILLEVIEHVLDSVKGFAEVSRVLEKGGKFIITTPCCYGHLHWLRHWILSNKPFARANFRSFLGNADHKMFWEPLSLCNILAMNNLKVTEMTTRNLALPYLPQFMKNPAWHFWPFSRMGTYLCIVAEKQ